MLNEFTNPAAPVVPDDKTRAVIRVADKLRAFEASLDATILRATEFAGELPQAWSEADVSIVVGAGAFERAGQAVAALMQVRGTTAEAHRLLDAVRDKIGVAETSWGYKPK